MKVGRNLALVVLLAAPALGTGGCRARAAKAAEDEPAPSAPPRWVDGSPHLEDRVDVEGIGLDYLDWGGAGEPVVLVHGLGGNPHIFDDLAPLLRAHHHVVAYAQRGHGDSDAPARGPYDLRARVGDLRGFLDRLKIDRADLVAWSTGGDEVTRFAAVAPERVDKLVYLDAGYDFSDPRFLAAYGKIVGDTRAVDADYASLDAYRAWFEDVWLGRGQAWTPGLEAFLRDRVRVADDGRVTPRMAGGVAKQLFASLEDRPRDYAHVTAPALMLYATTFFPLDSANAERAALTRDFERRVAAPFREVNMARVRRELRGATVQQLPGTTHMSIGVSGLESLAATIEAFLASTADGEPAAATSALAPPPFNAAPADRAAPVDKAAPGDDVIPPRGFPEDDRPRDAATPP